MYTKHKRLENKKRGIPCVNAHKSIYTDKVIEVMTRGITKIALWKDICEQLGDVK